MGSQGLEELKGLVTEALQRKGVLGKFKAQLRRSVISVLELEAGPALYQEGPRAAAACATEEGQLLAELLREYMQFYDLEYTASVFVPETGLPPQAVSREALAAQLGLAPPLPAAPLLAHLLTAVRAAPAPTPAVPAAEEPRRRSSSSEAAALKPYEAAYDDDEFESAEGAGAGGGGEGPPPVTAAATPIPTPTAPQDAAPPAQPREDTISYSDHSATGSEVNDFADLCDFVDVLPAASPRNDSQVQGDDDSDSDR